jgi:hypothetical protein
MGIEGVCHKGIQRTSALPYFHKRPLEKCKLQKVHGPFASIRFQKTLSPLEHATDRHR